MRPKRSATSVVFTFWVAEGRLRYCAGHFRRFSCQRDKIFSDVNNCVDTIKIDSIDDSKSVTLKLKDEEEH